MQLPSARGRARRGSNSPRPGLLDHTGLLCGCRAAASIPCSHERGFPRRLGEKRMRMPAARPHRAAQMQNSHCRPWDAEKLSAEIPSMLRLLPGIRTWHKEPVQITHSHNKPTPPHPELQNPHPWVLFAKRAKAPAISRAPCCRLSRSAVKLLSVVHGIGCCQQRKGGTVGESRTNTV